MVNLGNQIAGNDNDGIYIQERAPTATSSTGISSASISTGSTRCRTAGAASRLCSERREDHRHLGLGRPFPGTAWSGSTSSALEQPEHDPRQWIGSRPATARSATPQGGIRNLRYADLIRSRQRHSATAAPGSSSWRACWRRDRLQSHRRDAVDLVYRPNLGAVPPRHGVLGAEIPTTFCAPTPGRNLLAGQRPSARCPGQDDPRRRR